MKVLFGYENQYIFSDVNFCSIEVLIQSLTAISDRWSNPRLKHDIGIFCCLCAGRCIVYLKFLLFVILESLICLSLQNSNHDFDCSKCGSIILILQYRQWYQWVHISYRTINFCWIKMYIWINIWIFIPKYHLRRINQFLTIRT